MNPHTADELRATLRAARLRCTSARLAVLRYFDKRGHTSSHAETYHALRGTGFDRATLYRVLVDLAEAGILSRTDLGDHVWRFELAMAETHGGEHPHFVCIDCGDVLCLPGMSVQLQGAVPKAVAKHEVHVQLKGRCDKCA